MTESAAPRTAWWRTRAAIAWAVVVLVVAAVVIGARVHAVRAENTRVDTLYCTLSGVGPYDRGPRTGRSCADLLRDAGF